MRQRSALIDGLKVLASQLIVLHHVLLYAPMAQRVVPAWPRTAAFLLDEARFVVQIFLVIGGFLAAQGLSRPVANLPQSLLARYARLVPMLAVALLAVLAASALLPAGRWPDWVTPWPTVGQFAAHLLLLQDILGVPSLSAGAWYVSIDFQLFALLAIGSVLLQRRSGRPAWLTPLPWAVAMLALTSTGWVVPGLIGPAISGLMAEALGWRAVFLVLTPMALLAALLALPSLRTVPRGTQHPQAKQRVLFAIALSAGTGLVLGSASAPGALVAGVMIVAGAVLAVPSLRKLLPVGTLRAAPGLPAAIATMGLINLAFFGVDAFVPLMLVEVRGATIGFAGLALTAGTIAWSSGSWIQARISMRVSRRAMEWIGLTLLSAAILIIASVLLPSVPIFVGPLGWGLAGLGMGFAYITLNLTMLELAEPGQEGNASSSMQLASVLGSGVGTGIGGALVAVGHAQGNPIQHALALHFGLMLMAVLLGFFTARGLPQFIRPPANTRVAGAEA